MNPLYDLIVMNINGNSPYKDLAMIELMVETFKAMGKLSEEEYQELLLMIHPIIIE